MRFVFGGSSKNFYEMDDQHYLMVFQDAIHGNQRSDKINGTGACRKEFTYYFFKLLESKGIKTHLCKTKPQDISDGIIVQKCQPIKLEIIVRKHARGHWVDAHKIPLFEAGQTFDDPIVEFCLKMKTTLENGNQIDDPRINAGLIVALHNYAKDPEIRQNLLLNQQEVHVLEHLALNVYSIYSDFLLRNEWILEDFKFEVGLINNGEKREFVVIDEISPDCSRIRDSNGQSLTKDLFRQRRPEKEILERYSCLAEAIKRDSAV